MPHDFSACPRCHFPTKPTISYSEAPSEFWLECTNPKCNTFINTYIPQEHQESFHRDSHTFTGNFGGRKSIASEVK